MILTIWGISPPGYYDRPDICYRWVLEDKNFFLCSKIEYIHQGNCLRYGKLFAEKYGFKILEIEYAGRTNWEFLA